MLRAMRQLPSAVVKFLLPTSRGRRGYCTNSATVSWDRRVRLSADYDSAGQSRSRKYRAIGRSVNPAASYAARGGFVSRVAARLHDGDVHATAAHLLGRELGEPRADTAPLIGGIDADDVDHAHPLMKGVQGDRDETDRLSVSHRDEHVPFLVRARGSHRGSLALLPVGVQAEEDVVAEGILY